MFRSVLQMLVLSWPKRESTSRKEDRWKWGQTYKVTIKCSFTWNQSIVQQLMREGNILIRLLKASPMGLIANTTCRLARTRSMKKLYIASGVDSILRPWKQRDDKVTQFGRTNTTGHKTTSSEVIKVNTRSLHLTVNKKLQVLKFGELRNKQAW